MINEQLLQYIKKQREAGTADEEIKDKLRSAGWKDEDIADGFDAVSGNGNSPESHQQVRQEALDSGSGQTEPQPANSSGSSQAEQNEQSSTTQSSEQRQVSQQSSQQQSDGSQNKQDPNQQSGQKPRQQQQETQGQQGAEAQQQKQNAESKVEQDQGDNYREPVTEVDKQGAGATGPGRPAANEDPTPLRTMEADRQRVEGGEDQSTSADQAESLAAKQNNDQEELQEAVQEEVKKQKQKRQEKLERAEQKQQEALQESQRQSNKSAKGSVSSLEPTEPQSSSNNNQQKGSQKNRQKQDRIQQARKQSSSSGAMTVILSILGLLLIGGGAAYAYITYFQGPSNSTSAQAVLQSLADAQSFQYRIGINQQSNGNTDGNTEELVIQGAVDMNSDSSAQTYYTITSGEATSAAPVTGIASEFSRYPDLDERKQQTIQQAFYNQEFLQVNDFQTAQRLGATQNSSGFQTHRFGVTVNPERLLRAYTTIHEEIYGESINSQLASVLQDNLGNFTPEQGQLWVHPTSSVPYQLTVVGSNADGESIQVNMQFKSHGDEITAVTNAYESRSVASGLADYLGATSTSPQNATTSTTTASDDGQSSNSEQGDDSTTASNENNQQNTEAEMRLMRRQDQIRINDVQQLVVALQVYANENGQYPRTLAALAGGSVLNQMPQDPETGRRYSYKVTNSGDRYHLGATLRATNESELTDDENFNSEEVTTFAGGMNGAAENCASENQNGSTCYDRTGSLNN